MGFTGMLYHTQLVTPCPGYPQKVILPISASIMAGIAPMFLHALPNLSILIAIREL
jgi:hypothetical protein